eukprot:2731715-Amphidinium_carterae.1
MRRRIGYQRLVGPAWTYVSSLQRELLEPASTALQGRGVLPLRLMASGATGPQEVVAAQALTPALNCRQSTSLWGGSAGPRRAQGRWRAA